MSQPAVQAEALCGWTDSMPAFGIEPDEALARAGLDNGDVATSNRISLKRFARMAESVGERANHPAATWTIGLNYDLAQLGEIGTAITSAQTLGAALRRFADHFELLQDSTTLDFQVKDGTATVNYRILDPDIWPRHHDAMFSLGIVARIVRMAVPDAMDEIELGFECARRDTGLAMPLSRLSFGGEVNSLSLPVAMLDAAMPPSDARCNLKDLSTQIARKRRAEPARDRLAAMIFARMSQGEINQDELASEIGMSSRTMRRRLAEAQLTFQQLLDECRMRQAMLEFRTRPECSIAQVALRLGYAEHSNFTRAFTRWVGVPPQRYRADTLQSQH